jgi:hypothetical protein
MSITFPSVILFAALLTIYPSDLKTIIGIVDVPAGEASEYREIKRVNRGL